MIASFVFNVGPRCGVSAYRRIGVSAYRRIGVSAWRRVGVAAGVPQGRYECSQARRAHGNQQFKWSIQMNRIEQFGGVMLAVGHY
jgi:hypothetical protein